MEVAESGFALTDELAELWKLREIREEEWAAALNFLQAALGQEEFERFGTDQCTAVRAVIDNYLAAGVMDEDDVGRVRMILRRADFDPWKAISATPE